MSALLEAAIAAVRAGLERALSREGADRVTAKGGLDIVTAADVAAEDAVRAVLSARCPELAILGEERGGADVASACCWIDPICGTFNYASGLPLFCTNLALVEAGVVPLAVVDDGTNGEIYAALRGRGARAGDAPLRAREGALIVLETGGKPPFTGSLEQLGRVFARLAGDGRYQLRVLGTTLGFAKLATGDVAGVILIGTKADPLHTAAGCLLAEEAGACVTDGDGQPWTLESPTLVAAASPALHARLLAIVRG
jgi:myo-inositol-1(or 4)-monophosphatase